MTLETTLPTTQAARLYAHSGRESTLCLVEALRLPLRWIAICATSCLSIHLRTVGTFSLASSLAVNETSSTYGIEAAPSPPSN